MGGGTPESSGDGSAGRVRRDRGGRGRAVGPTPCHAVAEAEAATPTSDEAWIENVALPELQRVPDHQRPDVHYNENKQAYIKDITAGTFRQLVEAAEVCQVAIIHPGQATGSDEPGLDELIERAKPFQ